MFYVYVAKRPGVEEFLELVQQWYEVVVYTASLSLYADPLLDQIDTEGWVSYRLFREHCTFCGNAFVKDLSTLGRDLKDVIIVDNSPASYALQPENAVPILTWLDDMTDDRLAQLAPLLELFTHVDDVRPHIRQLFASDSVDFREAARVLQRQLTPETRLLNSWVGKGAMSERSHDTTNHKAAKPTSAAPEDSEGNKNKQAASKLGPC